MEEQILKVARELQAITDVKKLYLFNQKNSVGGSLSSFKLCAVVQALDKQALELQIYRQIDSAVPFDIVLYTLDEWSTLSSEEGTFAHKVLQTGCDLIE